MYVLFSQCQSFAGCPWNFLITTGPWLERQLHFNQQSNPYINIWVKMHDWQTTCIFLVHFPVFIFLLITAITPQVHKQKHYESKLHNKTVYVQVPAESLSSPCRPRLSSVVFRLGPLLKSGDPPSPSPIHMVRGFGGTTTSSVIPCNIKTTWFCFDLLQTSSYFSDHHTNSQVIYWFNTFNF